MQQPMEMFFKLKKKKDFTYILTCDFETIAAFCSNAPEGFTVLSYKPYVHRLKSMFNPNIYLLQHYWKYSYSPIIHMIYNN